MAWWALVAGIVVFAPVMASLASRGLHLEPAFADLARWLTLAVSAVDLLLSRTLALRPSPGAAPEALALARTLGAAALNEGAALFSVLVWTLSGSAIALVALLVSLLGLALAFPSQARWRRLRSAPTTGRSRPLAR